MTEPELRVRSRDAFFVSDACATVVTLEALTTVIQRHRVLTTSKRIFLPEMLAEVTTEMIAEAAAIDEAQGSMPPAKLEDLRAAIEGRSHQGNYMIMDGRGHSIVLDCLTEQGKRAARRAFR
ncbi:hypothetical protein Q2941_25365 [Bradyrhizobium sp. UFLA05-153]